MSKQSFIQFGEYGLKVQVRPVPIHKDMQQFITSMGTRCTPEWKKCLQSADLQLLLNTDKKAPKVSKDVMTKLDKLYKHPFVSSQSKLLIDIIRCTHACRARSFIVSELSQRYDRREMKS